MSLSFGSYIVFTALALYTERVRSWYLNGAPDALLEAYLGCCGNVRDQSISRVGFQMVFCDIVCISTAGLS